jgi:hypothetical protein
MSAHMVRIRGILVICGFTLAMNAQSIQVQPADPVEFPALVDSNSPAYWSDGQLYLYNSIDMPIRSEAVDVTRFGRARAVLIQGTNRWRWIEAAWADTDGTVYAWYHAEPLNVCPGLALTAPQIGAMVSNDGINFRDLGLVLRSGAKVNCDTANIYFAGGLGDFSVIPDRDGTFFYFLFTTYGGAVSTQGVAVARMAFEDRADPAGHVFKFFSGSFQEPGLGGRATPIFAAQADWSSDTPDSFWGPAIHWNTALQQYVVLMSHVAGDRFWGQDGIFVSFNPDLANPTAWTTPAKLLDGGAWYPQVLGYGPGETDTIAGAKARLFLMGHSEWDLNFIADGNSVVSRTAARVTLKRRR